jgi:hypothetical protein
MKKAPRSSREAAEELAKLLSTRESSSIPSLPQTSSAAATASSAVTSAAATVSYSSTTATPSSSLTSIPVLRPSQSITSKKGKNSNGKPRKDEETIDNITTSSGNIGSRSGGDGSGSGSGGDGTSSHGMTSSNVTVLKSSRSRKHRESGESGNKAHLPRLTASSTLSPHSEPFLPPSSYISAAPPPPPPSLFSPPPPLTTSIKSPSTFLGVSDREQSEIMARELREGSYECCVCFDTVALKDGIWACDTCYRIFHVRCAREWRDRSVPSAAAAGGGSASGGSNNMSNASSREPWRCPGCQATQHSVPSDKCFCGRTRSPELDPYITPHSCGGICGKRRGHGCPHPCADTCHPGPCSPCPAMGPTRSCSCGRVTYRSRCGVAPERDALAGEGGCGAVCGRTLRCGVTSHTCSKPCHRGECEPCNRLVTQSCFCGRHAEERPCGIDSDGGNKSSSSSMSLSTKLPRSSFLLLGDAGAAGPGILCAATDNCEASKGEGSEECSTGKARDERKVAIPIEPSVYLSKRSQILDQSNATVDDQIKPSTLFSKLLLAAAASSSDTITMETKTSFSADNDDDKISLASISKLAGQHSKSLLSSLPLTTVRKERLAIQHLREDSQKSNRSSSSSSSLSVSSSRDLQNSTISTVGFFSCGKVCGAWLDCGLHRCTSSCHTGDCSGCLLLPSRHSACACGQTDAKEFETSRLTCLDDLFTCGLKCVKPLSCGHECNALCHNGPCPPCTAMSAISCRCEASSAVLPCNVVYACVASGGDLQALLRKQHQLKAFLTKNTRTIGGGVGGSGHSSSGGGYSSIMDAATPTEEDVHHSVSQITDSNSIEALLSLLPPQAPSIAEALRLSLPVEVVAATLVHCSRACGRKLSCGRHRCARICCPLGSQKADEGSADDRAYEEARTESVMQLAEQVRGILKDEEEKEARYHQHHHQLLHNDNNKNDEDKAVEEGERVKSTDSSDPINTKKLERKGQGERGGARGIHVSVSDSLPSNPSGQASGHTCSRPCGKPLSCGRHSCDNPCHSGPCAECGHVDYTAPLRCACGRTSMPPPVRCGTTLPPCRYPCPIPRACGHNHAAWHTCHPDSFPCPPCAALTERLCSSGHEKRTVPCHISVITCSRPCGRALPCNDHLCTKPCHLGSCLDGSGALAEENERISKLIDNAAEEFGAKAVKTATDIWGQSNAIIESSSSLDGKGQSIAISRASRGEKAEDDDSAWESGSFFESSPDQTLSRLVDEALRAATSFASPVLDIGFLRRRAVKEFNERHSSRLFPRPSCGARCGKKKRLCEHFCSVPCHPGKMCPDLSCTESTTILCGCGRLAAKLPCLHGGFGADISKEKEMEMDLNSRSIPCDDLCLSSSRARAFGEATGIIDASSSLSSSSLSTMFSSASQTANNTSIGSIRMNSTPSVRSIVPSRVSPFPDALLIFSRENKVLAEKTEKALRDMLLSPEKYDGQGVAGAGINLQPMVKAHRAFVHQLAEVYGVNSSSFGIEPRRYVRLTKRSPSDTPVNGPSNRYTPSSAVKSSTNSGGGWTENNDLNTDMIGSKGSSSSSLSSSIGKYLEPGVVILPAMTLLEAAAFFSARLDRLQGISSNNNSGSGGGSGGGVRLSSLGTSASSGSVSIGNGSGVGGGGGTVMVNRWAAPPSSKANLLSSSSTSSSSSSSSSIVPPGALVPVHPSEPMLSNLGHLAGCMLHAFGVKAYMTGIDISNAIGIQGLIVRRLDDHNALIIHESLGKAKRTLEAYELSLRRGVVIPFKLRWWGVGVERWVRMESGKE